MAWRVPPVISKAEDGTIAGPQGSRVPRTQKRLLEATRASLKAVAEDVRSGLLETVGVRSSWEEESERASVVIELPPNADAEQIARAIDLENVEAWRDERGRVHIAIGPWYSTKDVDQVVLSITKVVHVMLGLHASDVQPGAPQGLLQKLLTAVAEVMALENKRQ